MRAVLLEREVLLKNKDIFCPLGSLGKLSLGSTTGANKFFYLNQEVIQKYDLPDRFLIKMTKSPKVSVSLAKITDKKQKYRESDKTVGQHQVDIA